MNLSVTMPGVLRDRWKRMLPVCLALILAACSSGSPSGGSSSGGRIDVRIAAIISAGQGLFSTALKDSGIGAKYGFNVQVVPISTTGAQWDSLRSGSADVASGSFLDLLRQRQAGLHAVGFFPFQRYDNPVLVAAHSNIHQWADLRGKKFGTPSATLLDYEILRATGAKVYGLDVGKQATTVPAAPNLLNNLLKKGQVNAALQFSSLAVDPVAAGQARVLTTVPEMLKAAGINPNAFYLQMTVSQSWMTAHPGAITRLAEAYRALFHRLLTNNAIWKPLVQQVGITEPRIAALYIRSQRAALARAYGPALAGPTKELLQDLIRVIGPENVGVSRFDPKAFIFPVSYP